MWLKLELDDLQFFTLIQLLTGSNNKENIVWLTYPISAANSNHMVYTVSIID